MKRKAGPVEQRLQYAGVRAFAGLMTALPLSIAVAVGRAVGAAVFRLDKRHRRQCMDAMQAGLALDEDAAYELTRRMYRHFGTMLAEFPRLPRLTAENVDQYVDFQNAPEVIQSIRDAGKALIIVTGHIGNWEMLGHVLALKGWTRGAIARPLDNPLIDAWIRRIRTSGGQIIWNKFGSMRPCLRAVRDRAGFGILMDQDGGQDGQFNTFMGRTCSTVPTVAEFALRGGAMLLPTALHRVAPMRFRFDIGEPFAPDPDRPPEEERARVLQRCNDELEQLIRMAPEQWMWLHRRWKTRPPEEARA